MKQGWSDKEIKSLFDLVEKNNKKNLPAMKSFEMYAKRSGKDKLTIRNFYYSFAKMLKIDTNLAKKLKINQKNHEIQQFEHFSKNEEKELLKQIDELVQDGFSVRGACQKLADGDIKKMIRLQNKYQNIKEKCKIIKFPEQSQNKNQKLSNSDINSLFLGLVKLVREQALGESEQKVKEYLEMTSQQKRKQIVDSQHQQNQIDLLRNQINELKEQNQKLNEKLKLYRIEYVNQLSKPNDNI